MKNKNMNSKVKTWYVKQFPSDSLGFEINPKITFTNILFCLINKEDVYPPLEVNDSLLRERVFAEIADRLGVEYKDVYNLWIN
jgi:hypothetical protein